MMHPEMILQLQVKYPDEDWDSEQVAYWNKIAKRYDRLYSNSWSKAEDEQTRQLLSQVINTNGCRILDLACGTGLGYDLCKSLINDFQYVGLDISRGMIEKLESKYPEVSSRVGEMADLSYFSSDSFDVVMSLYTSFSFTDKPKQTLCEIHRVLKPGGSVFISCLNCWSFRRLFHGKWKRYENYRTRNSQALRSSVPAWTYSRRQLSKLFLDSGFSSTAVHGQSCLAGVIEHQLLWRCNLIVSQMLPDLCHTLNVVAVKHSK